MPRKIDTAFIEYVPDFSSFERITNSTLDRIFADVERTADSATRDIEDSFEDMGRRVDDIFDEIGRSGETEFSQVARAADAAAGQVGSDFERGAEHAESSFDELRRSADRDFDRIQRSARSTSVATGKHFNIAGLAGAAAFAGVAAAGVAGLGALATMGLTSAASLEQTKISFDSLLGSADEGARVFKQLQEFAAATPFEFPEIADAAKRFLAFDESVGLTDAGLRDYLTTVGNVISVTGGGAEAFGRINLAIGQIGSASKITLDNLNQIADAIPGFSPIAAIAKGLGVSTAEAMDRVSAGVIPAAQGVQFLLKGMQAFPGAAGAMEKQSQTLLGVFSTFKDVIGQTLSEAFTPVIPTIKEALTSATPVIGDALKEIAPALGNLIAGLLPIITGFIKLVGPILTPILDALVPALKSIEPTLAPLGEALGQIVVALIPIIPLLAEFLVAVVELATPLIQLLVPVVKLLTPLLQFMADAVGEFAKWIGTINWGAVGNAIGGAFSDAWDAVFEFFSGLIEWFSKLPDVIGEFLASLPGKWVDGLGKMFDAALFVIGMGIGLLIASITEFPGMVIDALFALPGMLISFLTGMWTTAETTTTSFLDRMVDAIIALPGRWIAGLSLLLPIVGKFFSDAFNHGKEIVFKAINDIVAFVKSIPTRIGDFALNIGVSIVNFFKSFLNRAIDGLNSGIAKVDEIIPGSLPRIPRLAHGGIAMGPALIGEDSRTTPEAAIPLGDARAMAMLRQGLGSGGSVTFQPGSITVNIAGTTTPEQAKKIGENVGAGIANVLSQNNIRTAVRTV